PIKKTSRLAARIGTPILERFLAFYRLVENKRGSGTFFSPKKVPSMRTQLSSSVRHFFCGGPVICTARTPNVAGKTCFPCHRSFSLPSAPRTFFLPRPPH